MTGFEEILETSLNEFWIDIVLLFKVIFYIPGLKASLKKCKKIKINPFPMAVISFIFSLKIKD